MPHPLVGQPPAAPLVDSRAAGTARRTVACHWLHLGPEEPFGASSFSRNGKNKDQVKGISDAELKRFPVENVSWLEVQDFLNKLNASEKDVGWKFRLPTEAE